MADLATIQARLAEAEAALHRINTGSMVEEITSPSGDKIRYTAASAKNLEAYVTSLAAQAATLQPSSTTRSRRGPIYPVFDPS